MSLRRLWGGRIAPQPTTGPVETVPAPAEAEPAAPARAKAPPPHDYAAEATTLAHYFDFTTDDIEVSIAGCRAPAHEPVGRVAWFVPHFDTPYTGGIHTLLRVADHMRRTRGTVPVIVVIGAPDEAAPRAGIAQAFPELEAACEIVVLDRIDEVPELGPLDAAIATMWMTALPVLFIGDVRRKLYFIQDWEPEFYPAGSTSSLVAASYRFGFHAICNTAPLADAYRALGGSADHFVPAVDPAIFHARRPPREAGPPWRVFCYARPGHPRNCFEVVASALREVKGRLFDRIEIVAAGAEWDPAEHGLRNVVRNLGLLPYAETGDLYRSVDLGVCLMATRHPSYLPLEMMACGTAVVSGRNPHTEWLLRDRETAFVCAPSRSELADAIVDALENATLRAEVVARARAVIDATCSDWPAVCERIAAIVCPAGT